MNMPKDDVLNAILTDLVADQVIRALELGFSREEAARAVEIGVDHGAYEFNERQRQDKAMAKALRRKARPEGRG